MIVGVTWRRPVLTYATLVCETLLASVNSVNLAEITGVLSLQGVLLQFKIQFYTKYYLIFLYRAHRRVTDKFRVRILVWLVAVMNEG